VTTSQSVNPTRRERVEERETAIIEAAHQIFVKRGVDGAKMTEIARLAGIAEGTIYLYYKTKNDVMRALVAAFWEDLTANADAAVDADDTVWAQFHALASFHLIAMIERLDIVDLTQRMRGTVPDKATARGQLRAYVAVFDKIFRRGIDRGDIGGDANIWMARDTFFGTLEYSARTLVLRDDTDDSAVRSVVDNLLGQMSVALGAPTGRANDDAQTIATDLLSRLERAVERLETGSGSTESGRWSIGRPLR
jgi:AcrR family transcriptional regulator